ncbi:MAG: transcription elongation factor GreA [Clostridium sp.]|jgi:transcription elongation factor GreA|nr:transcription elongation factor GreA [Clostridium sp.]MCI5840296.1 transcription elongation factor GreA [Clostridium sp.]MDY5895246.1 transcription elongation factor GreA [Oscillospiraceae bacterium]CDC11947.1 transcription elongation factor GreA [Clostridium sp. CAG:413]
MEKQTVFTREDYNKLSAELNRLKTEGRDDIAEKIKEARSHGDLSENAEYDEAMNEQAKMEAEIAKLEADLRNAKILDEKELTTESIHIGSKVKLYDMDYEEEVEYKILGKSDIDNGIISDLSPVGSAIMGKKVGDIVSVNTPTGKVIEMKILAISK